MKFYCLLPVRDEADIIGQCLDHLIMWTDGIYIIDTGSVDETWEIVLDYASRNKKIKPLLKDDVYYSETRLRGFLFDKAREQMKDGDWFLRVDADEFHHISPVQFVNERLGKYETVVYHQYYNFELTEKEAGLLSTTEAISAERRRPIQDRRRYYTVPQYSEPRLCKYRSTMKWPSTVSFPYNAGFVAKERLPILHYPNRDPLQMERRCKLRNIMLQDKENKLNWKGVNDMHWTEDDWRKFLVKDEDPRLMFLPVDSMLQEVKQTNHLSPFYKRLLQRIVHSMMLPFLDAKRQAFSKEEYPQKIDQEVIDKLKRLLSEETIRCPA